MRPAPIIAAGGAAVSFVRQPRIERRWLYDAALAFGIVAIGLAELPGWGSSSSGWQLAQALTVLLASTVAVALRRSSIVLSFALVAAAAAMGHFWINGYNSTWIAELLVLYTVSERCSLAVSLLALLATFGMRPLSTGFDPAAASDLGYFLQVEAFYTTLAWFAGRAQARRQAKAVELQRIAALLAGEQARLVQGAVALERSRMTRDLEALVVGAVERMIADAAAARRELTLQVERAIPLISTIEAAGREALLQMRRLLSVLEASLDDRVRGATGVDGREDSRTDAGTSAVSPVASAAACSGGPRRRGERWLRRSSVRDVGVVAILGIFAAFEPLSGRADFMARPIDAFLAAFVIASLLLRRRYPVAVAAGIASVILASTLFRPSETTAADHAMVVAVFTVAALRGPLWGAAAVTAEVIAFAPLVPRYFAHVATLAFGVSVLVGWSALFVFAVVAGVAVREDDRLNDELIRRNELFRAAREERIASAVEDERGRIARDAHDMVTHGITLMVIHAGAARLLAVDDTRRADESLRTVESLGLDSLRELGALTGVPDRSTQPSNRAPGDDESVSIGDLVETVAGAGMPVELVVQGSVPESDGGLELSLYRIVQEALTNAAKHAPGGRVFVAVRYGPDAAEVTVTNLGGRIVRGDGIPGAGRGLAGIAERAALFGGHAESGPTADGGFRVHAVLARGRALV